MEKYLREIINVNINSYLNSIEHDPKLLIEAKSRQIFAIERAEQILNHTPKDKYFDWVVNSRISELIDDHTLPIKKIVINSPLGSNFLNAMGNPMKIDLLDGVEAICKIQRLYEGLNNFQSEAKPMQKQKESVPLSKNPPLRWLGKPQSLYVLFHILKESKFLKSDTEIAKHIVEHWHTANKEAFEIQEIETIRKQINNPTRMTDAKTLQVLSIISKAVKDIDNIFKIN